MTAVGRVTFGSPNPGLERLEKESSMAKSENEAGARGPAQPLRTLQKTPSVLLDESPGETSKVRETFHEHLAEQSHQLLTFARVARKAFKGWAPTNFSKAEPVALNYLWRGESLNQCLDAAVEKPHPWTRRGSL
jgi:hypothetical protein